MTEFFLQNTQSTKASAFLPLNISAVGCGLVDLFADFCCYFRILKEERRKKELGVN
jgi:hypothetical protein